MKEKIKKYLQRYVVVHYNEISNCMRRLHIPSKWLLLYRRELLQQYISEEYADIIEKYSKIPYNGVVSKDATVFVMWMQGEEAMPEIVKICFASIKAHAGRHPVVLITRENIRQYVSQCPLWDDEIFRALEEKRISFTNLSDMFRMAILYNYGGYWIDATILMNWDLDSFTLGLPFYSGRNLQRQFKSDPMNWEWITCFLCTDKGNPLMGMVFEVLLAQLKRHKHFIEYFMMDNAILCAYNNIPAIRDMISKSPADFDYRPHSADFMHKKYDEKEWNERRTRVPYIKMSYKVETKLTTEDGQLTNMGYILKNLHR